MPDSQRRPRARDGIGLDIPTSRDHESTESLVRAAMVGEVRSVLTPPRSPARGGKAPANPAASGRADGVRRGSRGVGDLRRHPSRELHHRPGGPGRVPVRRAHRPAGQPAVQPAPGRAAVRLDRIQAGRGSLYLPFTYTPFAALAFALISYVPWWLSQQLSVAVDIIALLAALWLTLGGLGYRRDQVPGSAPRCWAPRRSCGPSRSCAPCTWARSTWS